MRREVTQAAEGMLYLVCNLEGLCYSHLLSLVSGSQHCKMYDSKSATTSMFLSARVQKKTFCVTPQDAFKLLGARIMVKRFWRLWRAMSTSVDRTDRLPCGVLQQCGDEAARLWGRPCHLEGVGGSVQPESVS